MPAFATLDTHTLLDQNAARQVLHHADSAGQVLRKHMPRLLHMPWTEREDLACQLDLLAAALRQSADALRNE